jgi:hypothetical protein
MGVLANALRRHLLQEGEGTLHPFSLREKVAAEARRMRVIAAPLLR